VECADAEPGFRKSYVVFAQRDELTTDVVAWNAHATRFFATRIGLAAELDPSRGEASFVVAPDRGPPGVRRARGRPCTTEDHARAELADLRVGPTGLALLARRCRSVWTVERVEDGDRLALLFAAILASVLLGPILDEEARDLFGVKTARAKLEREGA
jgi:hypothetical protein